MADAKTPTSEIAPAITLTLRGLTIFVYNLKGLRELVFQSRGHLLMARDPKLRVKRVYDPPAPSDGARILVDRLWPRGMKKQAACLDAWVKEIAPSDALRKRFGHDPARWHEFQERYSAELDANPEAWRDLLERAQKETVTLLFSAHDSEHNNAIALKLYLEKCESRTGLKRAGKKRG